MEYFTKENVEESEYLLQLKTYNSGIPTIKPISYNKHTKILKMEKHHGMSVADMFGDTPEGLQEIIKNGTMKKIKLIVEKLKNIGIIYPDVTGYNFMIDNDNNISIIDFGHAFELTKKQYSHVMFVKDFTSNKHEYWNIEFK